MLAIVIFGARLVSEDTTAPSVHFVRPRNTGAWRQLQIGGYGGEVSSGTKGRLSKAQNAVRK